MSQYDILVLLAADQGLPISDDGFVDCSSPGDQS